MLKLLVPDIEHLEEEVTTTVIDDQLFDDITDEATSSHVFEDDEDVEWESDSLNLSSGSNCVNREDMFKGTGLTSNFHLDLEFTLDAGVRENPENEVLFESLRDYHAVLIREHLPIVHDWFETLSKLKPASHFVEKQRSVLLPKVQQLKDDVVNQLTMIQELGVR